MQAHDIDSGPSRTVQDLGDVPQLITDWRNRINKLAKWQIDSSSIEFPQGTDEFPGGHATVSRGLLISTSDAGKSPGESEDAKGGKGSSGENVMKKAIAVKKLKIENECDRERILGLALREAGLLVELSHTNVVTLEGIFEDLSSDRIWLIFPWEEHGNLKDFVASQDWEIPERISLIYDVTEGVEYLHTRNPPIYHGDLKSVNVLVTSKFRAVITDFGSARRLTKKGPDTQTTYTEDKSQQAPEFQATFCAPTNRMILTGNEYTLRWAAPELLKDEEPSLGSDIWSLGWIWYEVMTNSIPFQDVRKDTTVIKRVIRGNLPSVTDHARMSLILRLCSLMIKCWSMDPIKRPTAVYCRKSMDWMPTFIPDPKRTPNSGPRSPELLLQLGEMHYHQDDYINALRFYADALAIYTDSDNSEGKAFTLLRLAEVQRFQGDYSKATTSYSEAMQICTHIGDELGRANALYGLAKVHRRQGEYGKAIKLSHEVIQICNGIHNKPLKADALLVLAVVHGSQKDYNQAVTFFVEVKEISMDIGNRLGIANALWGIAEICGFQKEYSQAVKHLNEALQLYIDLGDRSGRANVLLSLADVHRDQDHHIKAISHYDQAAGIFKEIGNTGKAASASRGATRIRRRLGVQAA